MARLGPSWEDGTSPVYPLLVDRTPQDFRTFILGSPARARSKAARPNVPAYALPPSVPFKVIARCGLFTFVSVNAVFVGTTIWGFEHWRSKSLRLKDRLRRLNDQSILHQARRKLESILGRPFNANDIFWAIVACNLLVFIGCRSPLGSTMFRFFTNSPYSPSPALSMLLSVFTHTSLLHLGINMYVLHSFAPTMIATVGAGDFLSLFVGGGVFASFISLLGKAAIRSPIPSLGASGGVCAILGAFCLLQPNARLCIPFLVDIFPHSFEASSTAWALLLFEAFAAYALASRSPLDHAAHMGGLLFGMYYGLSGSESIVKRRNAIIAWWRRIRGY